MLFFPYSAKNSPERFPYVTLLLIASNTLLYVLTANLDSHSRDFENPFLTIHPEIVHRFAASWATIGKEPWRLLSCLFLHGDIFHLLGNMIVLWVFGPAVEGRIGHARYSLVYLLTGGLSGGFQSLVAGVMNPEQFIVGASGSIMGLAGAYLWLFPFATVCVTLMAPYVRVTYRGWMPCKITPITFDWYAQWVVLYLFVCDLWSAIWSDGYGGVANFAHIAGLMAGLGVVSLFKSPRDGKRVSQARKMRAEGVNLDALSVQELGDLLRREPDNERIILSYGKRVADFATTDWEPLFVDALNRFGPILSEKGPVKELGMAMAAVSPDRAKLPPTAVLRVGARLERSGSPEELRLAAQLYKAMFRQEKTSTDAEMALLRYAQVMERLVSTKLSDNLNEPVLLYQTLLRRFPASPHVFTAQEALKRLGAPVPSGF